MCPDPRGPNFFSLTVAWYVNLPPLIWTTTSGLSALRFASIVIEPVAPWKFFVCAIASRIALESIALARPMAS